MNKDTFSQSTEPSEHTSRLDVENVGSVYSPKDKEIKDRLSLEEIVSLMKKYFELNFELDYYISLEFSVAARLKGYLPNDICGYLHFYGASGTGKSHVAQFITEISRGDWLEAITEGALLAGVSSGKPIGIDEIDGQLKRTGTAEDILRIGHTWNATYRKMVPTEKGFKPQDFPCGGPKIITSIGLLEPALESRCYPIEMHKSSKTAEFAVRWAYRHDDVQMIAKSLDLYAEDIKKSIDGDTLQKWVLSEKHLIELKRLNNVHSRRTDLANLFTIIDHLLGWEIPGIIEAMARESLDEEKELLRSYLTELINIEKGKGVNINKEGIRASRILEFINQKQADAKLRPWNFRNFGKKMTEFSFIEDKNKIRREDGIYYLFDDNICKTFDKEFFQDQSEKIVQAISDSKKLTFEALIDKYGETFISELKKRGEIPIIGGRLE